MEVGIRWGILGVYLYHHRAMMFFLVILYVGLWLLEVGLTS